MHSISRLETPRVWLSWQLHERWISWFLASLKVAANCEILVVWIARHIGPISFWAAEHLTHLTYTSLAVYLTRWVLNLPWLQRARLRVLFNFSLAWLHCFACTNFAFTGHFQFFLPLTVYCFITKKLLTRSGGRCRLALTMIMTLPSLNPTCHSISYRASKIAELVCLNCSYITLRGVSWNGDATLTESNDSSVAILLYYF